MIKAVICRGIGFSLGTLKYLPTLGFSIGSGFVAGEKTFGGSGPATFRGSGERTFHAGARRTFKGQ